MERIRTHLCARAAVSLAFYLWNLQNSELAFDFLFIFRHRSFFFVCVCVFVRKKKRNTPKRADYEEWLKGKVGRNKKSNSLWSRLN